MKSLLAVLMVLFSLSIFDNVAWGQDRKKPVDIVILTDWEEDDPNDYTPSGLNCNWCTEYVLDVLWGEVAYHQFKRGNNPNIVDDSHESPFAEDSFENEDSFLNHPGTATYRPGLFLGDHRKNRNNRCGLMHLTCTRVPPSLYNRINALLVTDINWIDVDPESGLISEYNRERKSIQIYRCNNELIANIPLVVFKKNVVSNTSSNISGDI